ncbi:MAG: hypothetical protein Q9157_005399 [Trypethelium eluteriae]
MSLGTKCDEQKPRCSHCQRHSAVCEYPNLRKTSSASERSISVTPGPSLSEHPHVDADLNLTDLQLLSHWILIASRGFGDQAEDMMAWQKDLTEIACRFPFLMHGILAVSAFSMARLVPVAEGHHYLLAAAHHQSQTFPSYRQIISDVQRNMSEENCHAVIAAAHLIAVHSACSVGCPGLSDTIGQGQSSLNEVCEWLSLLRGARRIMLYRSDWTTTGPLSFHLGRPAPAIDLSCSPEDDHLAALGGLFANWDDSPGRHSPSDRDAYQMTLTLLRESYATSTYPQQHEQERAGLKMALLVWVEKFPQRFFELLSEPRPEALILLAHYCVLLQRRAARHWFLEGTAERIMSMVYHLLDEKWRHWVAWPVEEIRAHA